MNIEDLATIEDLIHVFGESKENERMIDLFNQCALTESHICLEEVIDNEEA